MAAHKSGKKGRKYGRNLKGPAHMRYTNERRWVKNKAKKILRYKKSHPNWKPYNISDEVRKLVIK